MVDTAGDVSTAGELLRALSQPDIGLSFQGIYIYRPAPGLEGVCVSVYSVSIFITNFSQILVLHCKF